MRMRQIAALALAALMMALCGCGAKEEKDKDGAMTIQPAQLSEEEQNLADLLALGMEDYHIFEFRAEKAKYLELNIYELENGEWSHLPGGGGIGLLEGNGRIALTFGRMTEGVRLAVQAKKANCSTSVQIEPGDDVSGMTFATSALSGSTAIELDQEIPLTVQIATTKNEIRSYDVDYFGMPREYAKHGYEHVYAITVTFSASDPAGPPDAPSDAPSSEPSPPQ